MKTLLAPTEQFIKQERSRLRSKVTAGSDKTIEVDNLDGFETNDFIVIGYEGSELCEMTYITSINSRKEAVVSTIKFSHPEGTTITQYRYDQRKFYGATSEDGTYYELTADGSPKTIQVDDPQGTQLEYAGSEEYTYFKATYYNSNTDEETSLADAEATLADETKRYTSIFNIRKHAGLVDNPFYPDLRIEIKRKQAESEVDSYLLRRYDLPLDEIPGLIEQVTTALAAGYIDFEEFGKDGEGVKWLSEARSILKKLVDGKQALIGSDGKELARQTKAGMAGGYPDENTDGPKFIMDQKF